MSFTMVSSAAILAKAGRNVNSSAASSGAILLQLADEAESFVNASTRINWVDIYSTVNVDTKYILQDTCSCHAAMGLINYDMSGFTSRYEAETMLDFLIDRINRNIEILKGTEWSDFVRSA